MATPPSKKKKQTQIALLPDQPTVRAEGEGFILPRFAPARTFSATGQPQRPLSFQEIQGMGMRGGFELLDKSFLQPLLLALDPPAEAGGALIDVGVAELVKRTLGEKRLSDLPFIDAPDQEFRQEQAERLARSKQTLSDIGGFLTGKGDLSGPELAGTLRERFQERDIDEQIALGVALDPAAAAAAVIPVVKSVSAGVKALRGGKVAREASEQAIKSADSLRVPSSQIDDLIEVEEAREAASLIEDIPDIVVPVRQVDTGRLQALENLQKPRGMSLSPEARVAERAEASAAIPQEVHDAIDRAIDDVVEFRNVGTAGNPAITPIFKDSLIDGPMVRVGSTSGRTTSPTMEQARTAVRATFIQDLLEEVRTGRPRTRPLTAGLSETDQSIILGTEQLVARPLQGAGQRPPGSITKPPPRKPGTPQGADSGAPPPRRPEVGLSDDLELPTFEKPTTGIMRKWEGARASEGLAMEEWSVNGQRTLRRLGLKTDEATMEPLYEVLHGEAGIDTLPSALREVYDDVKLLQQMEETDHLAFLSEVQGSGNSILMASDAKNFAARMMAHPDYFPRGWEPIKEVPAAVGVQRGRLGTTPSFRKTRSDATYKEIRASGRVPASYNPYAMMAERRIAGVQDREAVIFVNRLRQRGKVLPIDEAPEGWRVPRAGPVFEGRPIPDGHGGFFTTKQLAVPNDVAGFMETMFGKLPDIPGVHSIRKWSTLAKRFKLVGSLFQHVDFAFRALGVAASPTSIVRGGSLKFPSLMSRLMSVAWVPGDVKVTVLGKKVLQGRSSLRKDILSDKPIYKDFDISYKMLIEEGWGVQGDISLIRREFASFLDEPTVIRGLIGKPLEGLKKAQQFFEAGLFDGVYRESQRWALENFIIPWIRRTRPDATAKQVAAEAAGSVNEMFSTLGNWQTVLKNPFLREFAHTIMFSSNETEGLMRGAGKALSTMPQGGLFREWYIGLFISMAGMANVINLVATGRPLPLESYSPIKINDPYAPFTIGYNNRFMSPVIPFVKGRNDTDVYLDLVGQMDTAFRWALDPIGAAAARVNVIPRAIANQVKGETFFGEPLDTPIKRTSQLAIDLTAPIGATTALGAAREAVPAIRDVLPEGEGRLGVGGQLLQATGINLRGERTVDLLDRAALDSTGGEKTYEQLRPIDRADLRESSGVKEELERREETATSREQATAIYRTAADADRKEAADAISEVAERVGPSKILRDAISDALTILAAKRERLDDSSPDALEVFQNIEPKKTITDQALTRYLEQTQDEALEDPGLEGFDFNAGFNFEERERRVELLRRELGDQVINEVQEFLRRNEHPLQKELREDREFLEEYWDTTKRAVAIFGVESEYLEYLRTPLAFQRKVFLEGHAKLRFALSEATKEKRRIREFGDPEIERRLFKWEYVTSPINPALQQQIREEIEVAG